MNRPRHLSLHHLVLIGIVLLIFRNGNPCLAGSTANSVEVSFADVRRTLREQQVQYVIEEPPTHVRTTVADPTEPNEVPLQEMAEAFDYDWIQDGPIVQLRKRWTDVERYPSFSAEELAATAAQLLSIVQPYKVEWQDGVAPEFRFVLSFTPDQLAALEKQPVVVTALPPAQRKLLYDWGTDFYTIGSFPRLRSVQDVLRRPEAVRFVWGLLDPKRRRPDIVCYYRDPSRPLAALVVRDPRRDFTPRHPPKTIPPPPAISIRRPRPSSRRLPYEISIDRQDASVGDILREIELQVSVAITAPRYFRERRTSIHVKDVELSALLDAMGAVFGWEWDSTRRGRARLARPAHGTVSWKEMDSVLWHTLPRSLRAYLEPGPNRAGWPNRSEVAAALAGRRLYQSIIDQLAEPQGVSYAELSPTTQRCFLDWLALDQLARSFAWHNKRVPPWLVAPERTTLQIARGARAGTNTDEIHVRLVGPGTHGGMTTMGFSWDGRPVVLPAPLPRND